MGHNAEEPTPKGKWGFMTIFLIVFLLAGCTGTSKSGDPEGAATQLSENTPAPQPDPDPNPDPNAPSPTVSFSASANVLAAGVTATLNWSASGADSCTASGGWTGDRALSGSAVVGPLSAGTTFSLTCSGSGGSAIQMLSISVIGSVAVNWVAPTENVDGSALTDLAGYRIYYGQQSRDYSDMVQINDSAAVSHSLDLASGDYYLAMTALDAEGNESAYSNEVLKVRQ